MDCTVGKRDAEVSSVEGVSADVVVFEVRPNRACSIVCVSVILFERIDA